MAKNVKIKILESNSYSDLEDIVNDFIKYKDIIDIKFTVIVSTEEWFNTFITYIDTPTEK